MSDGCLFGALAVDFLISIATNVDSQENKVMGNVEGMTGNHELKWWTTKITSNHMRTVLSTYSWFKKKNRYDS